MMVPYVRERKKKQGSVLVSKEIDKQRMWWYSYGQIPGETKQKHNSCEEGSRKRQALETSLSIKNPVTVTFSARWDRQKAGELAIGFCGVYKSRMNTSLALSPTCCNPDWNFWSLRKKYTCCKIALRGERPTMKQARKIIITYKRKNTRHLNGSYNKGKYYSIKEFHVSKTTYLIWVVYIMFSVCVKLTWVSP